MAKLVNWYPIKLEYINNPTLSLRDLAEKHKISLEAIGTKASKEKWLHQRINRSTELEQRLNTEIGIDIVHEKAKLMREAAFVSGRGLLGIQAHFPRTAREGKELWESGATVKMKVLGIDKQGTDVNIQNNNFIGWDVFMNGMMDDSDESRTPISATEKAS